MDLQRRLVAEWLGTAFLLATVVGSGIMAERVEMSAWRCWPTPSPLAAAWSR
ncbi:hypothetical protein [Vogesella indigofera]|uniref:Major intrinsic protein n=1 Tax=Vogesella indigofera TaxID=45465 RepID=A0ABT5I8I3_VOGIN|nr:hypothetical protein [Vogesella indigofera]MDC7692337.1 hypothetical protein [Vogesella indigofera]